MAEKDNWQSGVVVSEGQIDYLTLIDKHANYIQVLEEKLALSSGMRVLDVGCGSGLQTCRLSRSIFPSTIDGFDISTLVLQDAKESRDSLNATNVNFITANANINFPFDANSYDVVFTNRVLQHLEDPYQAIQEMTRVTRQNGRVVTAEPDWSTLNLQHPDDSFTQKILETAMSKGFVKNPFSNKNLVDYFQSLGLKEIKVIKKIDLLDDKDLVIKIFNIPLIVELAIENGIDADQVKIWQHQLEELYPFEARITVVITSGVKQ